MKFQDLKLRVKDDIIHLDNSDITVRSYVPVNEKLQIISNVISKANDENHFFNPVKLEVYMCMEIIFAYTNIEFTTEDDDDITNLYDAFYSSGMLRRIMTAIPKSEIDQIEEWLDKIVDAITRYQNSFMGVVEVLSSTKAADNLNEQLQALQGSVSEIMGPEAITLLKDILTEMG